MTPAVMKSPVKHRVNGTRKWGARSSVGYLMFVSATAAMIVGWNTSWSSSLADMRRQQAMPSYTAVRSSYALNDEWTYPKYSTHTCIGQKFDDTWHMATCKFDNLCLNTTTLEFEYYQDPEYPETAIQYSQWGRELHDEFSEHLLHPGHALEDHRRRGWRPVVKRQPFPRPARFVKWAPQSQVLLQAVPIKYVYNFGHVMFDVLVPMFNMQHLFGVYTPDAQILVLDKHLNNTLKFNVRPKEEADTKESLIRRMRALINTTDPSASMVRLTWDHDIMWPRDYANKQMGRGRNKKGTPGLVCFKTVLAGTGHLSRRLSRIDALPYRQAVAEHLGLKELPQEFPTITLLDKKGRRVIENWKEVRNVLRKRYAGSGVRVKLVNFGERPNMTMTEQVKLMSDTSILLSPCGGLATVLTFLRPGATAIVMNYYHTLRRRSVHMEDQYYRNIEYLDIQYFPVVPEDYNNTHDRPRCELREGGGRWQDRRYRLSGALVNCNVRLEGKSLQRLVDYVDNAIMRWAARTGRYNVVASLKTKGRYPDGTQPVLDDSDEGDAEGAGNGAMAGDAAGSDGTGKLKQPEEAGAGDRGGQEEDEEESSEAIVTVSSAGDRAATAAERDGQQESGKESTVVPAARQ